MPTQTSNQVNTTPTIRIMHGKVVSFYSPVQVEALIPVEQRLARSAGSQFDVGNNGRHYSNHAIKENTY